jgi:hypothetical protein
MSFLVVYLNPAMYRLIRGRYFLSYCCCSVTKIIHSLSLLAYSIKFTGVNSEKKKLWPGTICIIGKPHHSESYGGVERRNRTMEETTKNWMHKNNTIPWSQSLPFIQWCCSTQIHTEIGGRCRTT